MLQLREPAHSPSPATGQARNTPQTTKAVNMPLSMPLTNGQCRGGGPRAAAHSVHLQILKPSCLAGGAQLLWVGMGARGAAAGSAGEQSKRTLLHSARQQLQSVHAALDRDEGVQTHFRLYPALPSYPSVAFPSSPPCGCHKSTPPPALCGPPAAARATAPPRRLTAAASAPAVSVAGAAAKGLIASTVGRLQESHPAHSAVHHPAGQQWRGGTQQLC